MKKTRKLVTAASIPKRVARSFQTAVRAKPAQPEGDIASDVSCEREGRPLACEPLEVPQREVADDQVDGAEQQAHPDLRPGTAFDGRLAERVDAPGRREHPGDRP